MITDLNRRYNVYIGIHAYSYYSYTAMHLPTGICILYVRLCSVHSYVSVDHFNVNHKQLLLKG